MTLDGTKAIAKADMGLTVDTRKGGLEMNDAALRSITDQARGKDLLFNLEVKDKTAEKVKTGAEKALEQAAANLQGSVESLLAKASVTEVTITSDGKEITTFGGNKLTVRLPVEKEETFAEGSSYKVVVVSADGEVETLSGKCVKYNAHMMVQVEVSHLSTFIVLNEKYGAAAGTGFTDVAQDAWYREAVEYAVAHGLMNDTSKTTFSPETVTTRAMIVTILHRLEGGSEAGTGNFTDVEPGKWYTEAIAWAAGHDIVQGYGNGKFGPDDTITREQMAAILYRYAAYKGYDISAQADLSGYADAGSVSGWASDAMRWTVAKGLIGGTSNTTLSPSGSALRCQVATILMRFCEGIA